MPKAFTLPESVSPIEMVYKPLMGKSTLEVPDIMEFVFSDRYLNRPNLYPRQGTVLKALFLQDELFTQYDYDVIGEWSKGFILPEAAGTDGHMRYQGTNGCQPDLLERIKINQEAGRKWFREAVMVIGRRGGKGFLGAIAGAYVLWNYLAIGNPQEFYGVDRDKRLSALVFAGKYSKARDEQWRDLNNVILGGPCFSEYVSKALGEQLTVYAPSDAARIRERESRGIRTETDVATFDIIPREGTLMGGRGPAAFLLYFDEMAHIVAAGASRSAEEVYGSATPALDQFGTDGFIYEGSSPWQMMGQYYENWENALEVDIHIDKDTKAKTIVPVYPEMFMLQLTSWDIYNDWEKAPQIKIREGWKKRFPPLARAIQTYDDQMKKLERANPETFAVERRSQWAAVLDAYLDPKRIQQMFRPWQGRPIVTQEIGHMSTIYNAHLDPSSVGANTGFALAHTEGPDEDGMMHVVFDIITHWEPGDFPDNNLQIDYEVIEDYLKHEVIDPFVPEQITTDQFNTVYILQRLNQYVRSKHFPRNVNIYERTATKKLNWQVAECFKSALNMGLVHGPYNEQAILEMTFLTDMGNQRVDHPDSGPVQTKDVFDAISNVVYSMIGEQMAAFLGQAFGEFNMTGDLQGGIRPFPSMDGESLQVIDQFRQLSSRDRMRQSNSSPARGVNSRRSGTLWSPSSPFGNRGR